MGKISKYSNLYDKDGNILHKVNSNGVLEDYSIEELEKLVDDLHEDESKKQEYNNATYILMQMYNKYGNPHEKELIERIQQQSKAKTTKEEIVEAINEIKD